MIVNHYTLYLISNVFNIAHARKQSLQPLEILTKIHKLIQFMIQVNYLHTNFAHPLFYFYLTLTIHLITLLNNALINISWRICDKNNVRTYVFAVISMIIFLKIRLCLAEN